MKRIFNDKTFKEKRRKLRNNMPEPERRLWYHLKNRQIEGLKFRRQCSVGPYILDFYCFEIKLCIEIDGDSHFESVKTISYDSRRTDYLQTQGVRVFRFGNQHIIENLELCLLRIKKEINLIKMTPSSLP